VSPLSLTTRVGLLISCSKQFLSTCFPSPATRSSPQTHHLPAPVCPQATAAEHAVTLRLRPRRPRLRAYAHPPAKILLRGAVVIDVAETQLHTKTEANPMACVASPSKIQDLTAAPEFAALPGRRVHGRAPKGHLLGNAFGHRLEVYNSVEPPMTLCRTEGSGSQPWERCDTGRGHSSPARGVAARAGGDSLSALEAVGRAGGRRPFHFHIFVGPELDFNRHKHYRRTGVGHVRPPSEAAPPGIAQRCTGDVPRRSGKLFFCTQVQPESYYSKVRNYPARPRLGCGCGRPPSCMAS
jgi:hypothetical protein